MSEPARVIPTARVIKPVQPTLRIRFHGTLGPRVGLLRRLSLDSPTWFYREAIEYQLHRLGAEGWRLQDEPALFKVEGSAADGDVELSSDVYGAILRQAREVLETLKHLNDNVGDARVAQALLGADPAGPR